MKSCKSYIRERNHSTLKVFGSRVRFSSTRRFFLPAVEANELCKKSKFFIKLSSTFLLRKRVLLRVEDSEFAKQLVYCILYCMVGHCFPLFIVLSLCVYCFANSVSST